MIVFSLLCEDGRQPLQAAAAQELDEEGLAQVGAVVGRGHAGAGDLLCQRGEKIVARKRGGVLQVQAVLFPEARHVAAARLELDAAGRAESAHPFLFLPGVAAQAVVEVGGQQAEGDVLLQFLQQQGQGDRILAARKAQDDRVAGADEFVVLDVFFEFREQEFHGCRGMFPLFPPWGKK